MAGTQSILTGRLFPLYLASTPQIASRLRQNWRGAAKWLNNKAGRCHATSKKIWNGRSISCAVSLSSRNKANRPMTAVLQERSSGRPNVERPRWVGKRHPRKSTKNQKKAAPGCPMRGPAAGIRSVVCATLPAPAESRSRRTREPAKCGLISCSRALFCL